MLFSVGILTAYDYGRGRRDQITDRIADFWIDKEIHKMCR